MATSSERELKYTYFPGEPFDGRDAAVRVYAGPLGAPIVTVPRLNGLAAVEFSAALGESMMVRLPSALAEMGRSGPMTGAVGST